MRKKAGLSCGSMEGRAAANRTLDKDFIALGVLVFLLLQLMPQPCCGTPASGPGELQSGDLYALVVGVSKYRDPKIPALDLADRDARAFGEFLRTQKRIFKTTRVTLLTNEKATKSEVEKYLYYTLPKAGKNDTIILFFSGHGGADPVRPNEFLFLTHDAEPEYLATTAVRMTGLDFLKGVEAERVLIIADACYSGRFATSGDDMKAKAAASSSLRSFLHEARSSSGRAIIMSGNKDQLSWEVPSLKHSVFTFNLIEGLKGKADKDHDGVVTLSEAYEYAYQQTREDTQGRQHPQIETKVAGTFPLSYVAPPLTPAQLKQQTMNSAKSGDLHKLTQLIGMGGDVNTRDEENNTILVQAARNGHAELVKLLLSRGADPAARNNKRETALMAACQKGQSDAVKLLLAAGAAVGVKDHEGFSPLAFAARGGHLEVVRLLLNKGAGMKCRTDSGKTPLMLAAGAGRKEVARFLFEKGSEINAKALDSSTAVTDAARRGHVEITRYLLGQGADISVKDGRYLDKELIRAVLREDLSEVEALLARGAATDAQTESGDSALSIAAGLHQVRMIGLLMKSGANPNLLLPSDDTPLMIAARNGRADVMKRLLDGGAEADMRDQEGNTALICACEHGSPEVVGLLLSAKANPNARNKKGSTAIILASETGRLETVRLLLQAGADAKAVDAQGNNALIISSRRGHAGIVRLLCERTVDVNVRNTRGRTALMLAATNGNKSVVKALLAKGADPRIEDWEGYTAQALAFDAGHEEVAGLLTQSAIVSTHAVSSD
ncbi:MAG: ankyrin repeat domain-containing protein [Thermodesulfobacteriota bacterium]